MPDVFVKPKEKPTLSQNKSQQVKPQTKPQSTKPEESKETATNSIPVNTNPNSLSLFTTFCQNPNNVKLLGQDKDEEVLIFLRRDFITNLIWIFNTILFAFLPIVVSPLLNLANINLGFLPLRVNILLFSFYYLLLIGYGLANFITWFYTIGVITNKKAVDIDFHGLSSIHVGTVNLADTSDAKYKHQGFFQSFFDFGDITITIEATKEQFVFEKTPRPAEITDMLSDLIGER